MIDCTHADMVSWSIIDELIKLSQQPLSDELEKLQIDSGGRTEIYYRFLYNLARFMNPNTCLEIGVWKGVASRMMLEATDNPVIGIDINPTKSAQKLCEQFSNYRYVIGDSTESYDAVKSLINKDLTIVYQDSSHHYLPSLKEFELYSQHLNGIWICDDITPAFNDSNGDMIQYFESLPGDKRLYDNLHHGSIQGLIIM